MMNFSQCLFYISVVWAGSLVGCAAPPVHTYADPRFDPAAIAGYAWIPQGNTLDGVVPANRGAVDTAILTTVESELTRRGWTKVTPEVADILLYYAVGAESRYIPTKTGTTTRYGAERTVVLDSKEQRFGQMVIDFIEPQSKVVWWRGISQGETVGVPSPQEVYEITQKYTTVILSELP